MNLDLFPLGWVHLVASLLALAGGTLIVLRPKGTPAHKRRGRGYARCSHRTLTSRFIETILLKDKYRAALTRRGVRIIGARFVERVDLENAELRHELWLVKSRLHDGADLSGLRSTRLIN